jgi:serine phosphatase RsbU (regulator of sigma subunit)
MEVQIGAAKVSKYATAESGDTIEMIERPHGGVSAVLVDGQRSGRSAKIISNIVARKAISLLGEGVRDGAVARATHDYLRTHRRGQVTAELQIASVDLATRSLVISRNTHCPAYLATADACRTLDQPSEPIGIHTSTKPVIVEVPLVPFTHVVLITDGMLLAAQRDQGGFDLAASICQTVGEGIDAQSLADRLLEAALCAENGRPRDDLSVMTLVVLPTEEPHRVRRLWARFPI